MKLLGSRNITNINIFLKSPFTKWASIKILSHFQAYVIVFKIMILKKGRDGLRALIIDLPSVKMFGAHAWKTIL